MGFAADELDLQPRLLSQHSGMEANLTAQRIGELLEVEAFDPFMSQPRVERSRMIHFHQRAGDDHTIKAANPKAGMEYRRDTMSAEDE